MVIASAQSGEVDEGLETAVRRLRKEADVDLRYSEGSDDLTKALDERGDRRIVVAGGDGALHFTVNALWERGELSRTPLALLPLGTGNDFARSLRGPLEPEPAAAALLAGNDEDLDLIICTAEDDDDKREYVVVNAAHFGIGARAGAAASSLKPYLGPLAYPLGSVAAGLSARGWKLTVEVDGGIVVRDERLLMVGFGNGRTAGGGTPMQPDADLDDGCLDLMVSTATGPISRLSWALDLRRGKHLDRDDTRGLRGRKVTVSGDAVPGNIDGEIVPAARRWTLRAESNAWTIRVPARDE